MEDLFPILMFIVFFLAPLLEGLKRKKKEGEGAPPKRRPLPRERQQRLPTPRAPTREPAPSRMEEVSGKPRVDESAATMVPDDLWEILTGQKRPPVMTAPQPLPETSRKPHWDVVYEPDEEAEADEEALTREDTEIETRRARVEAQSLETISRHPQPVVISLEENLPTVAQRHAAFHEKIAAKPEAQPPQKPQLTLLDFNDRAEVRRAFLLQEILGRPKGLE